MNENIDLTKILKYCPEGTKLYSTIHGEVTIITSNDTSQYYPISVRLNDKTVEVFTSEGKLLNEFDGECILFPSRDQRDWSKFKPKEPKFDPKTLQEYNKVLVRDDNDREWTAMLFSHINAKGKVIVAGCAWEQVIPYNDDTKHLVGTIEEAPEFYRYWEE